MKAIGLERMMQAGGEAFLTGAGRDSGKTESRFWHFGFGRLGSIPVHLWSFRGDRVVPEVNGLSYTDSRRKLETAGFCHRQAGCGQTGGAALCKRSQKQDPPAGTKVSKGSDCALSGCYGQYIPTREEQVAATDCSQFPGTRAYWDNNAGKPMCGCFDGLQWNLATRSALRQMFVKTNSAPERIRGALPGEELPKAKSTVYARRVLAGMHLVPAARNKFHQKSFAPEIILAVFPPEEMPAAM